MKSGFTLFSGTFCFCSPYLRLQIKLGINENRSARSKVLTFSPSLSLWLHGKPLSRIAVTFVIHRFGQFGVIFDRFPRRVNALYWRNRLQELLHS